MAGPQHMLPFHCRGEPSVTVMRAGGPQRLGFAINAVLTPISTLFGISEEKGIDGPRIFEFRLNPPFCFSRLFDPLQRLNAHAIGIATEIGKLKCSM